MTHISLVVRTALTTADCHDCLTSESAAKQDDRRYVSSMRACAQAGTDSRLRSELKALVWLTPPQSSNVNACQLRLSKDYSNTHDGQEGAYTVLKDKRAARRPHTDGQSAEWASYLA